MATIAVQSRALEVVAYIEDLIKEQDLRPGDRIATKEQVREQSGAARATVNEATKLLLERGRIAMRPGPKGGLFVAASDPGVQLGRFLLAVGEDAKSVSDAMALRDFLEEMVLREAVAHRSETDLVELREHVEEIRRAAGRTHEFVNRIWTLHLRIARITPNTTLSATYCGLVDFIRSTVYGQPTSAPAGAEDFAQRRIATHAELVEVIASGDSSRVREVVARHNAG